MQMNEEAPGSIKNRIDNLNAKGAANDSYLNKLFPIGANMSSRKYTEMKREEKHKNFKLKK